MKKLFNMLFILPALFSGCTMVSDQAGTSEQGNARVIAMAYRSDGQPASGAIVRIRPAGYVTNVASDNSPKSTLDLKTDSLGSVTIDSLSTGSYSIEITDNSKEAFLLKCAIDNTEARQIITMTDTLQPFASLKGKVDYNLVTDTPFIQVEGLERLIAVDSSGNYCLSDLPYGTYTIRVVSSDSSITPSIIKDVVVDIGRVTLAPYAGWIFSKNVFINTTVSGANILEDIFNFPVLIRLTKSNFRFDEASTTGADFRVFKSDSDSSALPIEIENWDSAAGKAEIWVKVDTVYANSNRHCFTLKWGNPSAQPATPEGAGVFDTAAGFKGVWHLGTPVDSVIKDQTINQFDGVATAVTSLPGIIGMSQSFDGISSKITVSGSAIDNLNFPEIGPFSISAWVKSDKLDSVFRAIVFKSNFQYGLQIRPEKKWEFVCFKDNTEWEMSRAPALSESWQFLVGVRKGTRQFFYVNGTCVDSSIVTLAVAVSRKTDLPLEIGHCSDGGLDPDRYFKGSIDEVRIAGVAYNANWIKLCYLNQKETDVLLKW